MSESSSTVTYRDVPGFPGYRVGDDGSVWGCRSRGFMNKTPGVYRKMTPALRKGRPVVNLCCGFGIKKITKRGVHQLVLLAFVGPCPDGMVGCHKNDNPLDNRLENLKWGTIKTNWEDARRNGKIWSIGERHHSAKLTADKVREIRSANGESCDLLAARFGVSNTAIKKVIQRKSWASIN